MTWFQKSFLAGLAVFAVASTALPTFAQTSPACSVIHSKSLIWTPPEKIKKHVIELPYQGSIPASLYREFDVNDLGRGIVERVRQLEEKYATSLAEESTEIVDVMSEADILLFFWKDDLGSISTRGFLNQHLSGKSKGMYDPSRRREAEDSFTGIKMGGFSESLTLRPKSAFLNIRAKTTLAGKSSLVTGQYGNIGAVLKSEIKQRSLWTSGDSLGLHLYGGYRDEYSLLVNRGSFFRKTLPDQCTFCSSYYEALIYGNVTFDDVDYFLVNHKDLAKALHPFGKPIYLLETEQRHGRVIYEKGQLLFEGEASKTPVIAEVAKPSVTVEAAPSDPWTEKLLKAGIKSSVKDVRSGIVKRDAFQANLVTTEKENYLIYTPRVTEEKFPEAMTELQTSLEKIANLGFPTRKVLASQDKFLIQEAHPTDIELEAIDSRYRYKVLGSLKNLIHELVEKKIYASGLRPSMLVMELSGELVIRGLDGIRERKSSADAAERFEEKLRPHWEKYFDEWSLKELDTYLMQLRTEYPKEKAS